MKQRAILLKECWPHVTEFIEQTLAGMKKP